MISVIGIIKKLFKQKKEIKYKPIPKHSSHLGYSLDYLNQLTVSELYELEQYHRQRARGHFQNVARIDDKLNRNRKNNYYIIA